MIDDPIFHVIPYLQTRKWTKQGPHVHQLTPVIDLMISHRSQASQPKTVKTQKYEIT